MNPIFSVVLMLLTGLSGSFPSAYLAGKCQGIDIRHYGSGNMGATNSLRILGKRWGLAVLGADALKGFLAAWVGFIAFEAWGAVLGGIFAVAMHTWNPWFGFKAVGKGVACGLGAAAFMIPPALLVVLTVFILTAVLSRYISLASILAALSALPMCFVVPTPLAYKIFVVVAVIFILFRHGENMKRLLAGTERRVAWGRSKAEQVKDGEGRIDDGDR